MSATTGAAAGVQTLADLLARLGGLPAERVLAAPPPGTATEADLLEMERRDRLCELVEGVLVEKAMGYRGSLLAAAIVLRLKRFVDERNLGLVSGAGMIRLARGLVRVPDVAFVSWDRVPGGRVPEEPIAGLAPSLAVEVLSAANTPGEMARKRAEYFAAGVRLVWEVDPRDRSATVHAGPGAPVRLGERGVLDGGDVLPGFMLPLGELFAELDRSA